MSDFVGTCNIHVSDGSQNISFPVLLMYPTGLPSQPVSFGPYSIEVALDAPILKGRFPLVVISHGGGSSQLVYRTIAYFLAQNGYMVAMPEHFGNNRNNNTLEGKIQNLQLRPHHLRLSIDAVSSDSKLKDYVDSTNVAVVGHSLGGYTALAVAGGQPWWSPDQKIKVTTDTRVKALVLLAPATNWFVPNDSLKEIKIPILLLTAEHDIITPRWQAQLLLDGVSNRAQVTWQIIENAGHLSFLSPFPPSMKRPDFPPSIDRDGFDREKFHEQLNKDILTFLRKVLIKLER